MRMALVGESLEEQVEQILWGMKEAGEIAHFEHHEKNSPEDQDGKDFTVMQLVGEAVVAKSFGVTISHRSQIEAKVRHHLTPQFWLPIGIKPETIRGKILALFL